MSWGLASKLAPYALIAALVVAVLWLRGDIIDARADEKAAQEQVTALTEANASLQQTIDIVRQMRVDNDAIAAALAKRLSGNQVREVHTRELIKEAVRNDPETRAWADTPVPDGVRAGLRAGQVDAPPR